MNTYLINFFKRTDDIEVLWRFAKACQFVSKYYSVAIKNSEKSKLVIEEGEYF